MGQNDESFSEKQIKNWYLLIEGYTETENAIKIVHFAIKKFAKILDMFSGYVYPSVKIYD